MGYRGQRTKKTRISSSHLSPGTKWAIKDEGRKGRGQAPAIWAQEPDGLWDMVSEGWGWKTRRTRNGLSSSHWSLKTTWALECDICEGWTRDCSMSLWKNIIPLFQLLSLCLWDSFSTAPCPAHQGTSYLLSHY